MVGPCDSKQTLQRWGNRAVDEEPATVLVTKRAPRQNCAQTSRVHEVEPLKIEHHFACPIGAHGFERSVELGRGVQVHLPAQNQDTVRSPSGDLDVKHRRHRSAIPTLAIGPQAHSRRARGHHSPKSITIIARSLKP
jgi:hypothetical protein